MMGLPLDWHRWATAADVAAVLAQVDAAQKRLAAEPRPDVAYVADVPADGTTEIRWWSVANGTWGKWHRVSGEGETDLGQAWRYLVGPGIALHRDEAVQVRPVIDPQTGQTLGQVA